MGKFINQSIKIAKKLFKEKKIKGLHKIGNLLKCHMRVIFDSV